MIDHLVPLTIDESDGGKNRRVYSVHSSEHFIVLFRRAVLYNSSFYPCTIENFLLLSRNAYGPAFDNRFIIVAIFEADIPIIST